MEKELNYDIPGVKTPPPLIFLGFGLFSIVLHYLKPLTITGPLWLVYLGVLTCCEMVTFIIVYRLFSIF